MDKIEIIYSRQSIDKKDSVSIEAQIDMCKKFLTSDNYENYIDKGWSGKNTDRPKMNELISNIKNDKVSKIIAYRLDRISRNIVDFGNLLTLFEKHNVEFVSATENFDTSTPMGKAMVYIVMVFAQLERETIAKRIGDNYKFRCSTGKFYMGGGVPFGYKSEKNIIDGKKASIIIPNENALILQEIFDRFTLGESMLTIARDLNKRNVKTNLGNLWSAISLKHILKNITPCVADEDLYNYLTAYNYNITNEIEDFDGSHGMCLFMKSKQRHTVTDIADQIAVVGTHEPLVSSDKYIKAQLLLQDNKNKISPKLSSRTYLAGLAKCKECGHSFGIKSMTKNTKKGSKKYAYYFCRGRLSRGICDNTIYILADKFEDTIIKASIKYLTKYENSTIDEEENTNKVSQSNEIQLLEIQIENLINNIGKGNSVVDNLLTDKITELQNRIYELKKDIQVNLHSSTLQLDIGLLLDQLKNINDYDTDQKSNIIRKIIDYIEVSKTGKIQIHYLI